MRRTLALLVALSAAAVFGACSSGDGEGGTLDIGGELAADVPAHEIDPYEERPEDFCKGQIRREEFSNWDWQCEDVMGLGKCVVISENHYTDDGSFYCALCGLKGDHMVCYMIQQD